MMAQSRPQEREEKRNQRRKRQQRQSSQAHQFVVMTTATTESQQMHSREVEPSTPPVAVVAVAARENLVEAYSPRESVRRLDHLVSNAALPDKNMLSTAVDSIPKVNDSLPNQPTQAYIPGKDRFVPTNGGRSGRLTMIPEFAYLAQAQVPILQPTPSRLKPALATWKPKHSVVRNIDSMSDISLVKNLTEMAQNMEVPNIEYIEHEGMFVPRMLPVPEGRRKTRTPKTSPPRPDRAVDPEPYMCNDRGTIDVAIDAETMTDPLVSGSAIAMDADDSENGTRKPPSTYFVLTQADSASPSGASARVRFSPSHGRVAIPPPQRLDGILIPSAKECPHHEQGGRSGGCVACRGAFFKERGLPSSSYVQVECRSATLARSNSPILMSVNTPERSYSCAVQSCYCTGTDQDGEKCPSCQERDNIARQFKTTWI
ncbi:hypothetical protein F4861DRAFT_547838 [Xylaria intraflava]|nr:hypothetical protein F4861DRAFT_547838 [Xylaria intraflava]